MLSKIIKEFADELQASVEQKEFVKLTFGKPTTKTQDIKNIYVRLISLKDTPTLSFTYRHAKKDIVKNHTIEEGVKLASTVLGENFLCGDLFTTKKNIQLKYNKKREPKIIYSKPTMLETLSEEHDKEKNRFIEADKNNVYLRSLGVIDQRGEVNKSMQDKFRQINKYIEIVDGIIKSKKELTQELKIVDMGAGKGYLTFALYDYLNNILGIKTFIKGVDFQENLIKSCNNIAKKANFINLEFVHGDINSFKEEKTDILIALHACNTATDDAIAKGIKADAEIIIVAPCCHKQVRQDMNCESVSKHYLKYGILQERQAEIVTDAIRALTMEAHGYKTNVFEFISLEHTNKNIMIAGQKSETPIDKDEIVKQIESIKKHYGIEKHYLEEKLAH